MDNIGFKIGIILKNPLRSLHLILYKLKILKTPKQLTIKTFFGYDMKIIIPDIVSSLLYLDNHFEPEVENALLRYLHKGDVFVDVGAHFGYFSLLAINIVGKKGKVFSFEPTPSTYKILVENVGKYPSANPIKKAVFSKKTTIPIHDFGLRFTSLNSLYPPRITKKIPGKDIKVETITLDSFFRNKSIRPNFIKIDAESSEYEILQGMTNILKKDKPIISMEKAVIKINGVASNDNLFNLLKSYGYKPYVYSKGKFVSCDPNTTSDYNILFLPKKISK